MKAKPETPETKAALDILEQRNDKSSALLAALKEDGHVDSSFRRWLTQFVVWGNRGYSDAITLYLKYPDLSLRALAIEKAPFAQVLRLIDSDTFSQETPPEEGESLLTSLEATVKRGNLSKIMLGMLAEKLRSTLANTKNLALRRAQARIFISLADKRVKNTDGSLFSQSKNPRERKFGITLLRRTGSAVDDKLPRKLAKSDADPQVRAVAKEAIMGTKKLIRSTSLEELQFLETHVLLYALYEKDTPKDRIKQFLAQRKDVASTILDEFRRDVTLNYKRWLITQIPETGANDEKLVSELMASSAPDLRAEGYRWFQSFGTKRYEAVLTRAMARTDEVALRAWQEIAEHGVSRKRQRVDFGFIVNHWHSLRKQPTEFRRLAPKIWPLLGPRHRVPILREL
ncbi:hypothetical protein WDW86_12020 [Bdellovibrionota bacterium FG-2]